MLCTKWASGVNKVSGQKHSCPQKENFLVNPAKTNEHRFVVIRAITFRIQMLGFSCWRAGEQTLWLPV